jgi:ectoine hydroxylase-related dioxygenase (phytanoyl-CoA dioxygenase family)
MVKKPITFSARDLPRLDGSRSSTGYDSGDRDLAEQATECLKTHGAVIIENLVPPDQMMNLKEDLDHYNGVFYGAAGSFAGQYTTRNAGKPLGESKTCQRLAQHSVVLDIVGRRLKPWCRRFVLGTCSAINVEPPPEPTPAQVLHRDEGMWAVSDWNDWIPSAQSDTERPEFSVSVMWAVTNFTKQNGATRVIPGSHRWDRTTTAATRTTNTEGDGGKSANAVNKKGSNLGYLDDLGAENQAHRATDPNAQREEDELEAQCIQATMDCGSVLLWSGATLHGASSHSMDCKDIRRGLLFIYNLGWLKSEHNFHYSMPPDVISSFPTELQELMGIVGQNRAAHPWYSGPVYAQPLLGSPQDDDDDEN